MGPGLGSLDCLVVSDTLFLVNWERILGFAFIMIGSEYFLASKLLKSEFARC